MCEVKPEIGWFVSKVVVDLFPAGWEAIRGQNIRQVDYRPGFYVSPDFGGRELSYMDLDGEETTFPVVTTRKLFMFDMRVTTDIPADNMSLYMESGILRYRGGSMSRIKGL